jgi:preprotein translocase subunit SecF
MSEDLSETSATEALVLGALDKNFGGPEAYTINMKSSFGSQTGQRFSRMAMIVVCLASFSILIYLWLRFELAFGVAAVIALIHDLIIVVLLSTIWNVQITLEVVAALMVLLGFSVNDTIVIFDRIRENTRSLFGMTFREICNLSINQSLARTFLTSGTTFIAVLMLLLVGGEGLRQFAKVILLGTIVGTYSSGFLATPLVFAWNEYKGNRLQQALASQKKKREAAKPVGRPSAIKPS